MGTRTLLNLALLGLVAALAAFALWGPGRHEQAAAPLHPLLGLDEGAIERLRIEQQGQAAIELQRTAEGWRMRAPYRIAANPVRVRRVLRLAHTPSQAEYPAAGLKPADFGLAAPKLQVVINGNLAVRFGDREPLSERRYVQVGTRLHLIDEGLYYMLQDRPAGYVTRRLLPDGLRPSGFDLPGVQLRRRQGRWQAEPAGTLGSADAAVSLAQAWAQAQGIDVRPYHSDRLKPEVTVYFDAHPPLHFELLRPNAKEVRFGRADLGLAWTLPAAAAARLLKPQPRRPAAAGD